MTTGLSAPNELAQRNCSGQEGHVDSLPPILEEAVLLYRSLLLGEADLDWLHGVLTSGIPIEAKNIAIFRAAHGLPPREPRSHV